MHPKTWSKWIHNINVKLNLIRFELEYSTKDSIKDPISAWGWLIDTCLYPKDFTL